MPETFTLYSTDIVYVDADENGNNSKRMLHVNEHTIELMNKEQTEYRIQIGTSIYAC
jgi:hypothetical protein